jgi:hypothetical protein
MGLGRPTLGLNQSRNDVGTVAVTVELKKQRNLGDHTENLEPDVTLAEARQINMAIRGAFKKITTPEQCIGVEINHKKRPMQFFSLGSCAVRWG